MGEGRDFMKVRTVSLQGVLRAQYFEILRLRRSIEELTLA